MEFGEFGGLLGAFGGLGLRGLGLGGFKGLGFIESYGTLVEFPHRAIIGFNVTCRHLNR